MSKYPIVHQQFYEYPYNVQADFICMKGLLYTAIEVEGQRLHVFNTHTQASYNGKDERNSLLTRLSQLQFIGQSVTKALATNNSNKNNSQRGYRQGELVMLMGDLNVNSTQPCWPKTFLEHHWPLFFSESQSATDTL